MKHLYFLIILLFVSSALAGQTRYVDKIFDEVQRTDSIVYCNNSYFSLLASNFDSPLPIHMNVYEPVGDTETERPVVIYAHTGNFLPNPANGVIGGTFNDSCVVYTCMELAKRGFVAIAADYRLGWNPLAPTQPERAKSIIRAAYRGVQDMRALNRYLRITYSEEGNPFGIDTGRLVLYGQGTGGYISLAVASLDDYNEILINKFFSEDGLPMVQEAIDGNIFGTSVGTNANGLIVNHITNPGYNSDYQMTINLGGAVGDSSWIDENTVPTISVQSPLDQFAPYTQGFVLVSGNQNLQVVEVQGAYVNQQKLNNLGVNDVFQDPLTDPISNYVNSINDGHYGLFPIGSLSASDSAPWEWYDPALNPNADPNAPLQTLEELRERGMLVVDSILTYFTARAYNVLDLAPPMAIINVSQESLNFGFVDINDTRDRTLTITNDGDATLEVSDIMINSTLFTADVSAFSLEPGESMDVVISFTPTAAGIYNGNITLTTNLGETVVPFTAEAVAETVFAASADATDLDFGTFATGETEEIVVTVNNDGTGPFTVTAASVGTAEYAVVGDLVEIPVGGSAAFTVSFSPPNPGVYSDVLTITTDATEPITVTLVGGGIWVTGINEVFNTKINVYPNPSNGQIQLDMADFSVGTQPVLVTIYDAVGKMVGYQMVENVPSQSLDLSILDSGIYFLRLDGEQGSALKKITVF